MLIKKQDTSRQIVCILFEPKYSTQANELAKQLTPYITNIYISPKNIDNLACKTFSICIFLGIENTAHLKVSNLFTKYMNYPKVDNTNKIFGDIVAVSNLFYKNIQNTEKSVIVFDLDETLVYNQKTLAYPEIFSDLQKYRQIFDYIVLWSHGTTDYVNESLAAINPHYDNDVPFKFDLMITRKHADIDVFYNKGLGYVLHELNTKFNVTSLKYAVLVDDKAFNFVNDYDLFVHLSKQPIQNRLYAKLLPTIQSMCNSKDNTSNIVTNERVIE